MKTYKLLILAVILAIGMGWRANAQEQTNQFQLTWNATGYTHNARGVLVATNVTQQTLVRKVAEDNGLNPADLIFVYRVEKLDTAVVYRRNGQFVSDVYQMEYTFQDETNQAATTDYIFSFLNDEYHPNAIGTTFGVEQRTYNHAGYLINYSYHGSFHYALPESDVVFTGTFSTGVRVKEIPADVDETP
ncbi:MAG TPA: hypothetical protein VGO67_06365 [Verrucomicrobiae bacterium]|jgi:hypothetical protein